MGDILTKQQILDSDDRKMERVPVPEWGGDVLVRTLSAKERDAYEGRHIHVVDGEAQFVFEGSSADLGTLAICDEAGKSLFAQAEVAALGEKSSAMMSRVCDVARRLNGLDTKAAERAEKNSETTQGDSSSTD